MINIEIYPKGTFDKLCVHYVGVYTGVYVQTIKELLDAFDIIYKMKEFVVTAEDPDEYNKYYYAFVINKNRKDFEQNLRKFEVDWDDVAVDARADIKQWKNNIEIHGHA